VPRSVACDIDAKEVDMVDDLLLATLTIVVGVLSGLGLAQGAPGASEEEP
jgi:hypothetical protein